MDSHQFVIPLSEDKKITLSFIKIDNFWICRMTDEAKNDLDRLLKEHFGVEK